MIIAKMNSKVPKELIFLCFLLTSKVISETNLCTFCRKNHVGVSFDPFLPLQEYNLIKKYDFKEIDLFPFLSKISSEFNTIFIHHIENSGTGHITAARLPQAIALFNTQTSKSTNPRILEALLLLDFHDNISATNYLTFLTSAQRTINEANRIHKGTIRRIKLYPNITEFQTGSFSQKLRLARGTFPKPKYKLGIMFNSAEFLSLIKTQREKLIFRATDDLELVDDVDLNIYCYLDAPLKFMLGREIESVKTCIQFIQSIFPNKIFQFGIQTKCPDTTNDGDTSYSRLVRFWKAIVEAALAENLTLVLHDAFDNPTREDLAQATSGWWRLRDNSSYKSTSQFVFEDKESISQRENENTPERQLSLFQEEFQFHREHIMIRLSPLVSTHNTRISQRINPNLLTALLSEISGKVSDIVISEQDSRNVLKWGGATGLESILERVSRHNAKNAKTQLRVTLLHEDKNGMPNIQSLIGQIVRANTAELRLITRLAIYPQEMSSMRLQDIHSALHSYKVEIGYFLPIDWCAYVEQTYRDDLDLKEMWQQVDFFIFSYVPGDTTIPSLITLPTYWTGVERVFAQVTSWFETCKRRIAGILPGKAVILQTGYPDSFRSIKEDYSSLAIFWKKMNAWAKHTNNTVIMFEAFDSTHEGIAANYSFQHMGWWRVTGNPTYDNEFGIEEKRTLAVTRLRETLANEKRKNSQPDGVALATGVTAFVVSIVFVFLVGLTLLALRRSRNLKEKQAATSASPISDSNVVSLPTSAFQPEASKIIGIGNSGTVYKSFFVQFQSIVAVKTISSDRATDEEYMASAVESLLSEIDVMSSVGQHENILRLFAVCQENPPFIVTEYCENGCLLYYLRSQSTLKLVPPLYELLQFCMEIASGMWFLEKKNVIHGDLSARNVLLDRYKTCKICDFGLSRKLDHYDKYIKSGEGPLPWRWMAYESLTQLEFSSKSDVWSMGVTFWEVFTLGSIPYPEMVWNEAFCNRLANGMRLDKPKLCDNNMYQVLLSCWNIQPKCRPSPEDLVCHLKGLISMEYADV